MIRSSRLLALATAFFSAGAVIAAQPEWETTPKLRYPPPTLVAPTVVDAPTGYAKLEFAPDEDVIVQVAPDRTRTRKLATVGGRHVRIIGGDLGTGDLQPAGMTGSLFLEGLKFDFAKDLPQINGQPVDMDGKQIHDAIHVVGVKPGTPNPPDVFVQNCYIGGTHGTNRAHATPIGLKTITADGGQFTVETVAPHGLAEDDVFTCGPTTDVLLDRTFRVSRVVSPTQVRATLRRKFAEPIPPGTTATGGYVWPQLAKVGKHADGYQCNDNTIQNVIHFYRVTFDAGYQAFIGGHAAGDRQARGLDMCRVNIRANNVWPRDEQSMLLYMGDTDQSGSGDPNKGRKQPFPINFDRVYIKPRPGLGIMNMVAPGPGTTRSGKPVGVFSDDNGQTARWPEALGFTGKITLSRDGFGEDGKDYADLTGPNAPGQNYKSPGYADVPPLVLKRITVPDNLTIAPDAKAGDTVARLDVEFSGAGHVIDLKLDDDEGGRFALNGRDLKLRGVRPPAGSYVVTVRASDQENDSNAITKKIALQVK